MFLETLGHASLLIQSTDMKPLLLTDPWISGSAYWRSWWLQNYPSDHLLNKIIKTPNVYITHEHPDHFHTASMRKFDNNVHFLFPDLPQKGFSEYMEENNYKFSSLRMMEWHKIGNNIELLSVPMWNDDSVLLINTEDAFIVNLNDAKPSKSMLRWIAKLIKGSKKYSILLSSYSPASIVNSFRKSGEELSIKSKVDYVNYLNDVCNLIKPKIFIPFASQVIFKRDDSKWANQHKVTYKDLKKYWNTETQLQRPYTKINLKTKEIEFLDESNYIRSSANSLKIAKDKEKENRNEKISHIEIEKLERKLKKLKLIYRILFPNSIGLKLEHESYSLNFKTKKIVSNGVNNNNDFIIEVPTGALKDAINYNHIGDLGITMFTLFHISEHTKISPKRVYLFLILITLDDYQHMASIKNFLKWSKVIILTKLKIFFSTVTIKS